MNILSLFRRSALNPRAPIPAAVETLSAAQQAQFIYAQMHSESMERERRALDPR